ncbi:hypothetical protein T492DRAFT_611799 [Pavlovales sp. CCMP2436]|nr:hypothetical protein T492DRAFT_611799 [Pavlovales sp. CCMP2436]
MPLALLAVAGLGALGLRPTSTHSFLQSSRAGATPRRTGLVRLAAGADKALDFPRGKLLTLFSNTAETAEWSEQDWERVYRSAERRGILPGFGSASGSIPTEVTVAELEQRTALTLQALTPRNSGAQLYLLGAAFFAVELLLAKSVGFESALVQTLPVTGLVFAVDQLLLGSKLTFAIILWLRPEYGAKLARHEAGHFLLAYLMGLPITGYFLSGASPAAGQAGTIFLDVELFEQLSRGQLKQSALARYSTILMGGIAAEAIAFDEAEGGSSDEQALVEMLTNLRPPWSKERVFNLARWSVVQAVELLREYKAEHELLATKMAAGAPLGECLGVIARGCEARQQKVAI